MNNNIEVKEKIYSENRVWVRIASSCNNTCIFCLDSDAHNGTFGKEDDIKKEMKDGLKDGYYNRVIISGGEASINPKFAEYIKFAKDIGYDKVQTVTNGNMFAIESFCKKVLEAGLDEVTFSFHGHNPTLHDYLVATPGAFKKSLKGLIYLKKNFPKLIINIDIVVNKINVAYLPDIIKFFIKLGVLEYDILQIIPFGRGFKEHKNKLFYDINEYRDKLQETWKLSKIPGMYMRTNRFPVEAFEGYEELIQDPRKIKSETMGEAYEMYDKFITKGKKPNCHGEKCDVCFLKQYCRGVENIGKNSNKIDFNTGKYYILKGELEVEKVYKKYGKTKNEFIDYINNVKLKKNQNLVNIPPCIRKENNDILYQDFDNFDLEKSLENYTKKYISDLYRKKSLNCSKCSYNKKCMGIHINYIRAYGFDILKPI